MHKTTQLVFSGVQPTGNLHLGNYLGAIKNWVTLQEQYPCIYCVVDMHALTTLTPAHELETSTREVTAAFIAAGIDPQKHIIFNQSRVMQHAELAWVFNCIARIGWMSRMTQFKDKAGKNKENASLGLFAYPSLMAADILLYRATHVPVGNDQKQHIELTRDIAQKFNNDYATRIQDLNLMQQDKQGFFPLVEPIINGTAMRIMSLRDGTKKMSKSDPSDFSRINLCDETDVIVQKIRKAKTDSDLIPDSLESLATRPEADNLIGIFAALANCHKEKALHNFAGKQFSDLKKQLIDVVTAHLAPITQEIRRLNQSPDHIDQILQAGAQRARIQAEKTMHHVRDIVGFLQDT